MIFLCDPVRLLKVTQDIKNYESVPTGSSVADPD
jgi:hypothetical protein